jgi:Short C-terminal domain
VQVLEVLACREDRQAIDQQVQYILTEAETPEQKHALFNQLRSYLDQRAEELHTQKLGGKDSPIYKRESDIILKLVNKHGLNSDVAQPASSAPEPNLMPMRELETSIKESESKEPKSEETKHKGGDFFAQIMRLKDMYESGLLTEEEFAVAKKQLMNAA